MKRAVILHGWEGNSSLHWYPWLKRQLETLSYEVWVPDLPDPNYPDVKKWSEFLLSSDWDFQDNLIIGHSSGAVEIMAFLQALPENIQVNTAILVSPFTEVRPQDYENLKGLFNRILDMDKIRSKALQFLVMHGDDDPICSPEDAKKICNQLHGEIYIIPGGQHFITEQDSKWRKFPELLEVIKQKVT